MALKPRGVSVGANSSSHLPPPGPEAKPLDPDGDELVMVFFPRPSWDAVCSLASDMGVSHQEALGAALALLRKRVDERKVSGGA